MVVITTKDIYIVEAKNRAGSISGNALEPTWKQRIGNTTNFTENQRSQMFAERENWKNVMPGDDTRFIVYVEGIVHGLGSEMQSIWPRVKLFRYNSNGVAAYRDDGVGFWYPDVIRTERVAWYSGQSYEWEKSCGRSDTKWMTHNYREAMRIYQNMKNELTDSIEFRTMDELEQYLSRRFGPCYIALYQ